MKLDDVLGVLAVVVLAGGWIAILIYFGFLWSLAYLVGAFVAFVIGLRYAMAHEHRAQESEA